MVFQGDSFLCSKLFWSALFDCRTDTTDQDMLSAVCELTNSKNSEPMYGNKRNVILYLACTALEKLKPLGTELRGQHWLRSPIQNYQNTEEAKI